MARLSARTFGEVASPVDSKSRKVVKLSSEQPLAERKETYDWYTPHNTCFALMRKLCFFDLCRDKPPDFKEEQTQLKKLHRKGKPKKGEGKRSAARE